MELKSSAMSFLGADNSPANVTFPESYVTFGPSFVNQSEDNARRLQAINDRKATLLLPAILVTVVLMLMGLIGNPLAIYIYGWRWRTSSTRVFLFALAVIDLMNCLITIPTEITIMREFYNFHSDGLCKVSRFTTYVMNNATSAIFLAIAVDRYIRICHPHINPVSARSAKIACGIGVMIGLAVAWPALFLYGRIEIKIPANPPVYGSMCLVHDDMEEYSLAFFSYLCSAFFVCVLILVVLYTLIGRTILKRKRMARMRKETTANTLETLGGHKNGNVKNIKVLEAQGAPGHPSHSPGPDEAECEEPKSPEEESLRGCNVQNFSFHCKKLRPPRATLMLFLITVVFITSFLPFLIISIIRQHRGRAFYLGLSRGEEVAVSIFARSYLVNNCTNPIVYGVCNSKFRQECKRLYLRLCRKATNSYTGSSNSRQNSLIYNRSRSLYETPKLERKVSPEP